MKSELLSLIFSAALHFGLDPALVGAVAKQESSLRTEVIGSHGEVGLFQIRPRYSRFSKEELKNPAINIIEGLRMLKFAKKHCVHQEDYLYIVCFNAGVTGGSKIKNPKEFDYYKKVMKRLNKD